MQYINDMKKLIGFIALLALGAGIRAQTNTLYERQLFIVGEDTLPCRILTPANYSPTKKYPLLVFLHGAGERGSDNEKQLFWGSGLFTDSLNRYRYPAIVVFPQCPTNSYWANVTRTDRKDSLGGFVFDTTATGPRKPLGLVLQFIDTLLAHGNIDPQRVYIAGLSMGGFGTFEALSRRPDLFAAAIPICGGGRTEYVKRYAPKLPIWVFHGDADPVVPVLFSRMMVDALKKQGAKVKYTEYPGVGHDSWQNAFREPEFLSWLFAQRKTGKPSRKTAP